MALRILSAKGHASRACPVAGALTTSLPLLPFAGCGGLGSIRHECKPSFSVPARYERSNSALLVFSGPGWYNTREVMNDMETKDILYELRTQNGLSQDALAERVFVTRQAVSRWENGETVPNTETLKLLSKLFDVSINTLLGAPRKLICQCCGMPLDDASISKEPDGTFNEEYCKWCYTGGRFAFPLRRGTSSALSAQTAPGKARPSAGKGKSTAIGFRADGCFLKFEPLSRTNSAAAAIVCPAASGLRELS